MGYRLMPHQQHVVDVANEVREDGSGWAYGVVVLTLQRQGGKTTLFGPNAVHRCLTRRDALVWLTAQTGNDARDLWMDIAKRIDRSPFAPPYTKMRRANGTEHMAFPATGSVFRPFPPVEEAQHGKANELVAVDEGWAFTDEQGTALEAAIAPTFTTTGGQLWIISAGGTDKSSWLLRHVLAGRAAVEADLRSGLAYFEWGVDAAAAAVISAGVAPDADPGAFTDAMDAITAAHPAAGFTLRRDALESAARTMKPGEFLRAYGNYWTGAGERIIPAQLWDAARRDRWPPPAGRALALGFAASVDHRDAAIVAAWRDNVGGPVRVDVISQRPGTTWLPDEITRICRDWRPVALGHDKAGPALDVADQLERADLGVPFAPTDTRGWAAACSAFLRHIVAGTLEHPGQPALDAAVSTAAKRSIGDGLWAWSRRGSGASIACLEAATCAVWALDHAPAPAAAPVVVAARPRPAPVAPHRHRRAG